MTLAKLAQVLAAAGSSAFYRQKLAKVGVVPSAIQSVRDYIQRVPFTTKAELLADHLAYPPFGSNLTQPLSAYTRFCQTSGTSTGQPMAWVDTPESWSAMLRCWRQVFHAAGLQPGLDRVFFAFSFGPFLGFWTAFEAAAADFLVIPGGGLSSQARLAMMARYGVTVICCTPTYALRLGELLGTEGAPAASALSVRKIIVAGEPGGSLAAVRSRIEQLWGARVFDHHGMTEVGPVSYESLDNPGYLSLMESSYFVEIMDPATGVEVADGECGELVLTTLDRLSCPLLRYRTGDWVRKSTSSGRLLLQGGILGRVDDMVVVRGVNLYPSAIEAVVRQFPEVVEFLVEQKKIEAMDEIELLVEVSTLQASAVIAALATRLRDAFSLRIPVRAVPIGSLPRHEFKSRRWQRA
jgi:phenylacetate-CoA ligase